MRKSTSVLLNLLLDPNASVPTADFSADSVLGVAPLTVQFTDLSTNTPTSWSWDFGDGSDPDTTQNPSHEYDTPGTYTVALTATNINGSDVETKVDYITVGDPDLVPVADFNVDSQSGFAPFTANFQDLSTNTPTSWAWDFGDGVGTDTVQDPSYEYADPGIYTVTLTTTNASGSDIEVKTAYIQVIDAPVGGGGSAKTLYKNLSLTRRTP